MADHRNVRMFPPRTTYNTNTNSTRRPSFGQSGGYGGSIFNVGRPMPSQSSSPMMLKELMSMLNNLFSLIGSFFQPKNVPTTTTTTTPTSEQQKLQQLKDTFKDDGYEFSVEDNSWVAKAPDGTKITGTTAEDLTEKLTEAINAKNKEKKETTKTNNGTTNANEGDDAANTGKTEVSRPQGNQESDPTKNKNNYGIGKKTEENYIVQSFDTWWAIVNERYEIPPGVDKNLVARHLAAANSGETDLTKALEMARKGITFKVGDSIKLPAELNIDGQTIKLKENSEAKARNPYSFGHFQYTAKVSQAGEKWFVTQNGEGLKDSDGKVRYFNTEHEANQYKEQLSQEDSS